MSDLGDAMGTGWLPDYPDFRDYSVERDRVSDKLQEAGQAVSISGMLTQVGVGEGQAPQLAPSTDLREWCPTVENQGSLGSCTAQAGVGLVEYFERRAFGKRVDASGLFLCKVTRNLMHLAGDTGAYLRSTMAALVLFGVPPEEHWPYAIGQFDVEPPAFG